MSGAGEQDARLAEQLYAHNSDIWQFTKAAGVRRAATSHRPSHQPARYQQLVVGKEKQKELRRSLRCRPSQEKENTGRYRVETANCKVGSPPTNVHTAWAHVYLDKLLLDKLFNLIFRVSVSG